MKRISVRRAILCVPSNLKDAEMSGFLQQTFGDVPVLVISVVDETLEAFLGDGPRRGIFTAAVRESEEGYFSVVLVLQYNALQLRCIVSLAHPAFPSFLAYAKATKHVNVLLHSDASDRVGAIRPPFDERDTAMLLAIAKFRASVSAERLVTDAIMTAADCRDIDELPSTFPDITVERVEVSVVPLSDDDDAATGETVSVEQAPSQPRSDELLHEETHVAALKTPPHID